MLKYVSVFYIARGITSPPKIKFSLTQRIFMLSVVISILTKPVGKSLVLSRQLRKFSVAPHLACAVRYVGRNLFCRHDSPTEKLAFAITGRRLISYDTRVIQFRLATPNSHVKANPWCTCLFLYIHIYKHIILCIML